MKFIVSSSILLKQLTHINGVITSNPVVPILENFLFEIGDGMLTVTASDLNMSMITEVDVEANETGSIAVPAKILMETLRNLPEQPITISIDFDTYSLEISSDNGRYRLACENALDFPKVPEVSNSSNINISTDALASAITNTIFATSSDELRPAMTGVYMKLSETNTTFVATDGHRMVRYRRVDVASDEETSIIIPRKALNLLKTTLPIENTNVNIEFNPTHAFFRFNNIRMTCRLIDEKFPDYENVIPLDNENSVTIKKADLLGSLKRISIYANKSTNQIRCKITGSELQISAEDLDFSNEANERLSCDHDGEDLEIGYNARLLIELLNNVEGNNINIKLSQPNRATLIIPEDMAENEDILMLVMPVMITQR
ncbi:MAG: DNA polymerase III subunit beta [Cyclobacteriaceae bacterium]